MTCVLLFCIAEEAKQSIPTILKTSPLRFFLVDSKNCPREESGFKSTMQEATEFATPFFDASPTTCQEWALSAQETALFIEPNIIAIADARTAKDGTISMQWYHDGEGVDYPPYGVLPPRANTWYDFRIVAEHAIAVISCLVFTEPDVVHPRHFGRKDELTDEKGVLDAKKADALIRGLV